MKITRNVGRKAISPVIATVILIAITLIAAVAIAGFVFGIFGSFTSKPAVTVSPATVLTHNTVSPFCPGGGPIYLINSGTASGTISAVTISFGGQTFSLTGTTSLTAGTTQPFTVSCGAATLISSSAGEAYTLTVVLTDGTAVPYTGTFS